MNTGVPLECHWLIQCTVGYHWVAQKILAGYIGTPLEQHSWNSLTLLCHSINSDYYSLHWNTTGGTHTQAHIVKQSNIHASLKWQDGGTPSSKWTGFFVNSAFTWSRPVLLFKRVSSSTSLSACFWYEYHFSICAFGVAVQMKSA